MTTETRQDIAFESRELGRSIWNLLRLIVEENWAASFWRLPGTQDINCEIDVSGASPISHIDLESLPGGFLFCPYDKGENILIRSDIGISTESGNIIYSDRVNEPVRNQIEDLLGKESVQMADVKYFVGSDARSADVDRDSFESTIENAVHKIKKGVFEKVVPSRTRTQNLSSHFEVGNFFQQLCDEYSEAFIYFTTIPGIGSWLGATPELLLEVIASRDFRTISLAGTQTSRDGIAPEDVAWTQKDIEEQALVSRYIINCFKHIRLREFEGHGPKTVVAGNLMHLKTSFDVDMEATGFHNLGTTMLNLLHPTSAVCGMPKEAAKKFLENCETHDRTYFAGFLGPVNHKENIHLYVNLRCMQLMENKAILYAGAGVTEDSTPEREWEETELKLNTLLNVLNK